MLKKLDKRGNLYQMKEVYVIDAKWLIDAKSLVFRLDSYDLTLLLTVDLNSE